MNIKKLNANGFAHDIVAVFFVTAIAIIGAGLYVVSHAATPNTGQVVSDLTFQTSHLCLNAVGRTSQTTAPNSALTNKNIDAITCKGGTKSEIWQVVPTRKTSINGQSLQAYAIKYPGSRYCVGVNAPGGRLTVAQPLVQLFDCGATQAAYNASFQQWALFHGMLVNINSKAVASGSPMCMATTGINSMTHLSKCVFSVVLRGQQWKLPIKAAGGAGGASPTRLLVTSNILSGLATKDPAIAQEFFNTPQAFVKSNPVNGYAATPIASYTSYAQFAQDLADGKFPKGYTWVMYGIESTTNTPTIEKQHPDVYLPKFAKLAHQHHLKVIEVPGVDLVYVAGSDCHYKYPETSAQAYIRCHIPSDANQADIYLIEAQGDESNLNEYVSLVNSAVTQVRAANPKITVMSGLTTDRGNSVAQIVACWKATHNKVAGYWLNSTAPTLAEADQVLQSIQ